MWNNYNKGHFQEKAILWNLVKLLCNFQNICQVIGFYDTKVIYFMEILLVFFNLLLVTGQLFNLSTCPYMKRDFKKWMKFTSLSMIFDLSFLWNMS